MQCVIASENLAISYSCNAIKLVRNVIFFFSENFTMENQESGNLSTTNNYDSLGDLIYYDDDDGSSGREKSKITKPYKLSLINHKNIAYNILKYLEDDMVENKEILELGQCSKCMNNILTSPIRALTILSCRHIFYRSCIEKQLLHTKPNTCPFTNCGKNVDIIVDPNSIRRGSQSSQSSRTLALTNLIGKKVILNLPVIPEEGRPSDPMDMDPDGNVALMNVLLSDGRQRSSETTGVAKETSNQTTNPDNSENVDDSELSSKQIQHPICEKYSEEISIDFQKYTFLSCSHAVHLNCINDLRKRCPTCASTDNLEMISVEQALSTTQKRSSDLPEKSSSKKQKTSNKEGVPSMLKKLIEELLTDNSNNEDLEESTEGVPDASLNSGNFFHLSSMIDQAEEKNKDTTQNVINRYFDFGEALHLRYKKLKSSRNKYGAEALIKDEVGNKSL
ncbi:hypothetical protein C1645_789796 [Glomus cerebriforme]|uniref:RING-type domain-containing protein n=1 Tax=Glomus cerebriforme TaxID=658196 RepID=A0A397SCH1_9GLOM|nr:hypothetical protein C1645_789796 [Glomus cerebriforme]